MSDRPARPAPAARPAPPAAWARPVPAATRAPWERPGPRARAAAWAAADSSTGTAGASGGPGAGGSRPAVAARAAPGGEAARRAPRERRGRAARTGGEAARRDPAGSTGTGGCAGAAMPSAGCGTATAAPKTALHDRRLRDDARVHHQDSDRLRSQSSLPADLRVSRADVRRRVRRRRRVPTTAEPRSLLRHGAAVRGTTIFVAAQALSASWTNANDIPYVNAMIARSRPICASIRPHVRERLQHGRDPDPRARVREPDVFRAIAPMSGSLTVGHLLRARSRRLLGSHGTNDPTINISKGRAVRDAFRMRNHCATTTVAGSPAGCVNYPGLRPRLSRRLVRVRRRSRAAAVLSAPRSGLFFSILIE